MVGVVNVLRCGSWRRVARWNGTSTRKGLIMGSAVKNTLGKAVLERVSPGSKPGALRAMAAAAIVGIGAAVATYKLLRSGE